MPGVSPSTTLQYAGIGAFIAILLFVLIYYSRSINSRGLARRSNADANDAATVRPGLADDDVAVLPMFTYHDASPGRRDDGGSACAAAAVDCCAVCLDELREGALVRMLPSCKHYFHAGCVDVWLLSHATCPVCRASPGPEKVRMGLASLSPPLPQLRRCGASPKGGEASRARDAVPSRSSSSPAGMSPTRSELFVQMGSGGLVMSPSLSRPRTPESGARWSRSPSPVMTDSYVS